MKTIDLTLKIRGTEKHAHGELIIGVTKICDALICANKFNYGITQINQFESKESIKTFLPKIVLKDNTHILVGNAIGNKLENSKETLLTILRLFCEYQIININII